MIRPSVVGENVVSLILFVFLININDLIFRSEELDPQVRGGADRQPLPGDVRGGKGEKLFKR